MQCKNYRRLWLLTVAHCRDYDAAKAEIDIAVDLVDGVGEGCGKDRDRGRIVPVGAQLCAG
jgi:hypothetical protein